MSSSQKPTVSEAIDTLKEHEDPNELAYLYMNYACPRSPVHTIHHVITVEKAVPLMKVIERVATDSKSKVTVDLDFDIPTYTIVTKLMLQRKIYSGYEEWLEEFVGYLTIDELAQVDFPEFWHIYFQHIGKDKTTIPGLIKNKKYNVLRDNASKLHISILQEGLFHCIKEKDEEGFDIIYPLVQHLNPERIKYTCTEHSFEHGLQVVS